MKILQVSDDYQENKDQSLRPSEKVGIKTISVFLAYLCICGLFSIILTVFKLD